MGRYKSVLMAERDARSFPHHVDVIVPPMGLGKQMDVMAAWLQANCSAGWRSHGKRAAGVHIARYMFEARTEAEAFEAVRATGLFTDQS